MSRKLYVVTIELEACVYANSVREAEAIARENVSAMDGEMDDATFNARFLVSESEKKLYWNTIPWGEDTGRTVSDIAETEEKP